MSDLSCLVSTNDDTEYLGKNKGWLKMKLFFVLRNEVDFDEVEK